MFVSRTPSNPKPDRLGFVGGLRDRRLPGLLDGGWILCPHIHRNLRKWLWGRYATDPGLENLRGIQMILPRQQGLLFSSLQLMGNTSAFTAPAASAWAVITFGWRLPPISLLGQTPMPHAHPRPGMWDSDASEQEPLPSARTEVGWRSTTAPAKTALPQCPHSSTWIIHPGCLLKRRTAHGTFGGIRTQRLLRECMFTNGHLLEGDKLTTLFTRPPTP